MARISPETKVGLFVVLGIALLVYMSMSLGGFRFGKEAGYTASVKFPSAAGLDKDAAVTVAGVEVGKVKKILLDDNMARLILQIRPGVRIGKDFTAVLRTRGLLGEKYVELMPGSPDAPPVEDGGELSRTAVHTDMDELMTLLGSVAKDIEGVSSALNNVLGGEEGEQTLRTIVSNIEEITTKVNKIVDKNDDRLANIMVNFENFSAQLRSDGPGIAKGLKDVSESLKVVIDENRGDLKAGVENLRSASQKLGQTMDSIQKLTEDVSPKLEKTVDSIGSVAQKIDEGKGTLGKLINEPTTHDNVNKTLAGINRYIEKSESFRTYVSYRGEYLYDADDTKSYLSLRLQPKSDKYYLFEVVDDPRGKRKEKQHEIITKTGPTVTEDISTTDSIEFSAQIAKRYANTTLRGGIIQSRGGFGIDQYLFDERLRLTFEAFDFDKERNPRLKAGLTYFINKYFFVTAGYDDFISRYGFESPYFGIGIEFEDEDLKYLFTNAPPLAF
ncbi:MAG: MCE family protein [Deltaproteobacteria bacterium]|nr:MCE family protein [Deltaproteobacteria bacterium]